MLKHWRLPHDAIFFARPYFCSGHFISLSRWEMLHRSQPSSFFVLILSSAKDGVINYQPATFFPFTLLILLIAHEKPSLPTSSSLSLPPSYFIFLWFSSSESGYYSNESLPLPFKNIILFSRQLEKEWHCSLLRWL